MGALALADTKGRSRLPLDCRQAKSWCERLLVAYERGRYLGEIDERFISFQKRQLGYTEQALGVQMVREERIAKASPRELQIIAIANRYREEYERPVNAIDRREGGPAGKARFRAEVERLGLKSLAARDKEIAALKKRVED